MSSSPSNLSSEFESWALKVECELVLEKMLDI